MRREPRPLVLLALAFAGVAGSARAEGGEEVREAVREEGPAAPERPLCAGDPQSAARSVREIHGDLVAAWREALPGPTGAAMKDRAAERIARDALDADRFTREVLRRAWDEADDYRRTKWRIVLEEVLHQRYLDRLKDPRDHRLQVRASHVSCNEARVEVDLDRPKGGPRTPVVLRLGWRDGVWKVWDVQVDGTSLVSTYRSRFGKLLREGGVEGIDAQLTSMAENLRIPLPPPPEPPADDSIPGGGAPPSEEGGG